MVPTPHFLSHPPSHSTLHTIFFVILKLTVADLLFVLGCELYFQFDLSCVESLNTIQAAVELGWVTRLPPSKTSGHPIPALNLNI